MKILSQKRGTIVESEGFYMREELTCYAIKDSKTHLTLGKYVVRERVCRIFDEMTREFINPSKACYYMPQE